MSKAREEAKRLIVETKICLQLGNLNESLKDIIANKKSRLESFDILLLSANAQLKRSQGLLERSKCIRNELKSIHEMNMKKLDRIKNDNKE